MMTPKLSDKIERISLEDLATVRYHLDEILMIINCRTYGFNIASDMLTDSEETQS